MERPGIHISLIIPVFRDADVVLECLRSLTSDPDAADLDVVVVDDASGDDTPDRIAEARLPGVRLIKRSVNGGFARACSEGWRNRDPQRAIVGVLNADTVVEPGWLLACWNVLMADPGRGCVVPSVVRWDDPERLDSAGQSYATCGWGFRRGHDQPASTYDQVQDVFGPTGCAMLARADAIEACGGLFREEFECYYEDTELGFRLHRGGFRCTHVPAARVRHRISLTYDRIPRRRAYFVSRNSTVLFWTAVPVRRWWSAVPQRCCLSAMLAIKAIRQRCLMAFLRGRLEAWPMIVRGPSLRRSRAAQTFSRGWLKEVRRSRAAAREAQR
ncbi:MAG: glycosyltransferase family 2 protein [Planctomycetota bacterium]|nr:glycosyltransferase family 2 protein [Planctomycetota bacterium]